MSDSFFNPHSGSGFSSYLAEQNNELLTEIAALKEENEKLREDVKWLDKVNDDYASTINSLDKEIERLKKEIQNLNKGNERHSVSATLAIGEEMHTKEKLELAKAALDLADTMFCGIHAMLTQSACQDYTKKEIAVGVLKAQSDMRKALAEIGE